MKRVIIFSVTLLFMSVSKAQVEVGIFAGPHISSAFYSSKGYNQPTDPKFGFHAGLLCKIPFDNHLFFSPDISYRLMGYKVTLNHPSYPPDLLAINNNTTFHEIDIDPLLQYDFNKKVSHFFVKAGPSFEFILTGKENYDLATGGHVEQDMKFSTTNYYGRYGVAAVAQFGFEKSGDFSVYGNYIVYLMSMNNEDTGPTIRNWLTGITFCKYIKSLH